MGFGFGGSDDFIGGLRPRTRATVRAAPIPEVATVTIQPRQVELTTELPGRTSAYLVAEIRPQVNGIIKKRLFKEGSDVKAGQVLYQIDPAPFQVALDNAKAALGKAEANLPSLRLKAERCRELLADKAVSQQDYDDAAAALKQAEAEVAYWKTAVETARINLGYTRVTAPISGRIGRSSVTDGALVTAYQPMALATIQQLDPIYVDVTQSTAELLRLKQSLEAGKVCADSKNDRKVSILLEDGTPIPWKARCNSATSRWTRPPGRSSCGSSFPIPRTCSCRACSSGRWWRKASTSRPSSFPSRASPAIPRETPRPDRGCGRQGRSSGCSPWIGPSATNGSSPPDCLPAIA